MRRSMLLATVATLALSMSCAAMGEDKEKESGGADEKEVTMKLDQVPAAVQTTLKEEARGATIDEVDKISEDGLTVYETDVQIKGKSYEIQVAEDGTLVSKKWERDDDDKGGEQEGKDDKEDDDDAKEKK